MGNAGFISSTVVLKFAATRTIKPKYGGGGCHVYLELSFLTSAAAEAMLLETPRPKPQTVNPYYAPHPKSYSPTVAIYTTLETREQPYRHRPLQKTLKGTLDSLVAARD